MLTDDPNCIVTCHTALKTPEGKVSRPTQMIIVANEFKSNAAKNVPQNASKEERQQKEHKKPGTCKSSREMTNKINDKPNKLRHVPARRNPTESTAAGDGQKNESLSRKTKSNACTKKPVSRECLNLIQKDHSGKLKREVVFQINTNQSIRQNRRCQTRAQTKLTIPKSPHLSKRSRFVREPVLSTTDRELMEMATAREVAAKRRRQNNVSLNRLHQGITTLKKATHESMNSKEKTLNQVSKHPMRTRQMTTKMPQVQGPVTRSQTKHRGPPQLATSRRAIIYKYTKPKPLSTEEREAKEMNSIPKFKARKVDSRVMHRHGILGLPAMKKRKATEPIEPQLSTDNRIGRKTRKLADKEGNNSVLSNSRTHTQNTARTSNRVGKPTLTIPMSPAFMTKYRTRSITRKEANNEKDSKFQARLQTNDRKPVGLKPFQFKTHIRGKIHQQRFKESITKQEEREKVARIPRAALVPKTNSIPSVPNKPQKKDATVPSPFKLESMTLHENALVKWEREREQENQIENNLRNFIAKDNPMFSSFKAPDVPKSRPTEIAPFVFKTQSRAPLRSDFKKSVLTRNQEREAIQEKERIEKEERDKLELAEWRKSLYIKANPIPAVNADGASSTEKKTRIMKAGPQRVPQSPVFHTRTRAMLKAMR